MNRIVVLLFVLLIGLTAWSQQTSSISGVITDEKGEPVFSANVIVDAANGWAAVTDFDGKYTIKLPAGEYYVLVRLI